VSKGKGGDWTQARRFGLQKEPRGTRNMCRWNCALEARKGSMPWGALQKWWLAPLGASTVNSYVFYSSRRLPPLRSAKANHPGLFSVQTRSILLWHYGQSRSHLREGCCPAHQNTNSDGSPVAMGLTHITHGLQAPRLLSSSLSHHLIPPRPRTSHYRNVMSCNVQYLDKVATSSSRRRLLHPVMHPFSFYPTLRPWKSALSSCNKTRTGPLGEAGVP